MVHGAITGWSYSIFFEWITWGGNCRRDFSSRLRMSGAASGNKPKTETVPLQNLFSDLQHGAIAIFFTSSPRLEYLSVADGYLTDRSLLSARIVSPTADRPVIHFKHDYENFWCHFPPKVSWTIFFNNAVATAQDTFFVAVLLFRSPDRGLYLPYESTLNQNSKHFTFSSPLHHLFLVPHHVLCSRFDCFAAIRP